MIIFPPEYVKTKYPGYVWNVQQKKLFSMKSGVLVPMTIQRPYYAVRREWGYPVSVNGRKRFLSKTYLESLNKEAKHIQVIDVQDS